MTWDRAGGFLLSSSREERGTTDGNIAHTPCGAIVGVRQSGKSRRDEGNDYIEICLTAPRVRIPAVHLCLRRGLLRLENAFSTCSFVLKTYT